MLPKITIRCAVAGAASRRGRNYSSATGYLAKESRHKASGLLATCAKKETKAGRARV